MIDFFIEFKGFWATWINNQNKLALTKLGKKSIINFKPSKYLTKAIA